MASPLKRGEKVLYASSSGEVTGQVKEDEADGKVLLDIRSRAVAASLVKRQRRERARETAARPVDPAEGPLIAPAARPEGPPLAPEAGADIPPSEGPPVAPAARPVAPAASTDLPEPAGAAQPLQPREQNPQDSGQTSRAPPGGAARQPGEPDEAITDAIATWMGGVRGCRGLVDNLQTVYPDKAAAIELRNALVSKFSKKPRAGVSWSNFDAVPKGSSPVAVAGHIHPAHLNYTPAVAQDMSPYMDDVARAVREIITHGVGDVVLHVRPTAFPPLAAANYEHPAAFLWGPDDSYQSYVHFFAILAIVHILVARGLPGAAQPLPRA